MKNIKAEQLRNVGLFSHGGAGKTSLSEAMLFNVGIINRLGRVDEGTTVSDFDPDETKRHISVQLSLLPFEWKGTKINVVDTPGYFDFIGEVKEGMRVVDGAVLLYDAVAGIEVGSENMWKMADERNLARLALVNRIDRENADFVRVVEQLREKYGSGVTPIQLPIGSQNSFRGVVDLVTMKAYSFPKMEEMPIPGDMSDRVTEYRDKMVEAAAEQDDELINKYLEGEELTEEEIRRGVRGATLAGKLVPVLVASATENKGIQPVIDAIVDYLPSPVDMGTTTATNPQTHQEESLAPSGTGPLAALVFKTAADPYVGKLTYFRVYSGEMRSDSQAHNANKTRDERIGQMFMIRGKTQEPVDRVIAGDIGAVAKLQETTTGDTLCHKDHPLTLPGIAFPLPAYSAAIEPKTKVDLDKLGPSLNRIVEEDPTLHVRKDPDTGETIISGMGESHVDIAIEKMKRKFGVDVLLSTPKIPYKETITVGTKAEYKHKKQTGGHGQYGHVFLELEPQPRGTGFEFAEKVVGGSVPRNFIPAVEKGVREAIPQGILAGYPVVDVKVILYDGSYHPVDSSEMAFKVASSQALKKGMENAKPVLLEPIMTLTVTVPEQYMGDVMGDLNSKRARVLGMEPQDGLSVIKAQAPLAEIQHYAADLRSITQGRGQYTMEFSHYEEVPAHLTQQIVAEAKKAQAES